MTMITIANAVRILRAVDLRKTSRPDNSEFIEAHRPDSISSFFLNLDDSVIDLVQGADGTFAMQTSSTDCG